MLSKQDRAARAGYQWAAANRRRDARWFAERGECRSHAEAMAGARQYLLAAWKVTQRG